MNKIFFGIHTSLLLLLCALLACCSQDEEEYAPTEKLVPLDISAVIDGMGTRAEFYDGGYGSFEKDDEITITIDGDESGKSYIYAYDGSNWNPKNDDNRLLISSDADNLTLIAEYGAADYSNLPISLTALKDNLIAYASVDFNHSKAEFSFKHKACKLQIYINIKDIEITNINICNIRVSDPSISGKEEAFKGQFGTSVDYEYYPEEDGESTLLTTIYVPKTADKMIIDINFTSGVSSQEKSYMIEFRQQLEGNKSYKCYLR
jgi:hypothetical protein